MSVWCSKCQPPKHKLWFTVQRLIFSVSKDRGMQLSPPWIPETSCVPSAAFPQQGLWCRRRSSHCENPHIGFSLFPHPSPQSSVLLFFSLKWYFKHWEPLICPFLDSYSASSTRKQELPLTCKCKLQVSVLVTVSKKTNRNTRHQDGVAIAPTSHEPIDLNSVCLFKHYYVLCCGSFYITNINWKSTKVQQNESRPDIKWGSHSWNYQLALFITGRKCSVSPSVQTSHTLVWTG